MIKKRPVLIIADMPGDQVSAADAGYGAGNDVPSKLRTLHNLVIQYAGQKRYEVRFVVEN